MTLPTDLNAKDTATKDRMEKMDGAAFDKAYVRDMVMDHHHDIAGFQKEASGGHDSDVKGFASQTLPTLQEHLKMIQGIQGKMGGSKMGAGKKMSGDSKMTDDKMSH